MPNYKLGLTDRNDLSYGWELYPKPEGGYLSRWKRYNLTVAEKQIPFPAEIHVKKHRSSSRKKPHTFGFNQGPHFFSPQLRNFIESFEPDTHEWYPIKVVSPVPFFSDTYHILRIPVEIDTAGLGEELRVPKRFSEELAQGHHLWRARGTGTHCSEAFRDAIIDSEFKDHLSFTRLLQPGEPFELLLKDLE